MPVTAAWSPEQLAERLPQLGRECRHLVLISVSPMDLDVEQARTQARNRRRDLLIALGALGAGVLLLIVVPRLRAAAWSGLGGVWVWAVLAVVLQLRYRGRVGPVRKDSQAESFVMPLLWPTTVTNAVAGRWLGWNESADVVLLTQEERWTYAGPQGELKLRWTTADGAITHVDPAGGRWRPLVRFTFADESDVVLDLPKPSRVEVLRSWSADD